MDHGEQIVKRLMTAVKCSVCGSPYEIDNIVVLGHQEDLWFLTVTCGRCHTKGLVAALIKEASHGESAAGPAPALDQNEIPIPQAERARSPGRVTADDVLDVHQFLQEFDGDFARLFAGEGESRP